MWLYVSRGKYGGKKTTVKKYAKISLWGGGGFILFKFITGGQIYPGTTHSRAKTYFIVAWFEPQIFWSQFNIRN